MNLIVLDLFHLCFSYVESFKYLKEFIICIKKQAPGHSFGPIIPIFPNGSNQRIYLYRFDRVNE